MEVAIKEYAIGIEMHAEMQKWYKTNFNMRKFKLSDCDAAYERFILEGLNETSDKLHTSLSFEDSSPAVGVISKSISWWCQKERTRTSWVHLRDRWIRLIELHNSMESPKAVVLGKSIAVSYFISGKERNRIIALSANELELLGMNEVEAIPIILRYRGIIQLGNHWGFPRGHFDVLYKTLGIRYEGFASSLNSRMKRYDDGGYCCLFGKDESAFGGLGSFFEVDMLEHEGNWAVNPPFVEQIIFNAVDRVKDAFRRAVKMGRKLVVVLYLTDWPDVNAILDGMNEYICHQTFVKGDVDNPFVLEDHQGKPIPGNFNCRYTMLVTGYDVDEIIDLRRKFMDSLDSLRP